MSDKDYAGNFQDFLTQVPGDQPFCFWLGTHEPHRGYEDGAGGRTGKDPAKVKVPPIFPDNEVVRSDILDYFVEIEHFDQMVSRAIQALEEAGQLDNTMVVVTSDHGMPFPRAKASLYDAGSQVPLAIRWPEGIQNPGRDVHAFVNLSDLAPTFLQAAGLRPPRMLTRLERLNLSDCKVTSDGLALLVGLRELQDLDISGSAIDAEALAPLSELQSLRRLNLARTELNESALERIGSFTALKELDLGGLRITADGLQHLESLDQLRVLQLGLLPMTNEHLPSLKRLLGRNSLDLRGVAMFRASPTVEWGQTVDLSIIADLVHRGFGDLEEVRNVEDLQFAFVGRQNGIPNSRPTQPNGPEPISSGDILKLWIDGVWGRKGAGPPDEWPDGFPVPVYQDGTVSLPIVGKLRIAGLTRRQATTCIADAYAVRNVETQIVLNLFRESWPRTSSMPDAFADSEE